MVAFTMSNSTNVKRTDFPLIEFVKRMYEPAEGDDSRDNILFENIEQIGRNIEKKY